MVRNCYFLKNHENWRCDKNIKNACRICRISTFYGSLFLQKSTNLTHQWQIRNSPKNFTNFDFVCLETGRHEIQVKTDTDHWLLLFCWVELNFESWVAGPKRQQVAETFCIFADFQYPKLFWYETETVNCWWLKSWIVELFFCRRCDPERSDIVFVSSEITETAKIEIQNYFVSLLTLFGVKLKLTSDARLTTERLEELSRISKAE